MFYRNQATGLYRFHPIKVVTPCLISKKDSSFLEARRRIYFRNMNLILQIYGLAVIIIRTAAVTEVKTCVKIVPIPFIR